MSVSYFAVSDRVRWSEVDGAGIIYFGAYVRFIELAETELMRAIGLPYSEVFRTLRHLAAACASGVRLLLAGAPRRAAGSDRGTLTSRPLPEEGIVAALEPYRVQEVER